MPLGSYVILDLETTGLDPQLEGILEIAAVRLVAGEPVARYQRLVDPGVEISPGSQAIHGIDAGMIEGAPKVAEVLPELLAFIGDAPLVAHNAPFDVNFLNRALGLAGLSPLDNAIYDTLEIAKEVFPAQRSYKLEALCHLLGRPATTFHRALDDAEHLAAIFPVMLRLYRQKQEWYRLQFARIEHVAFRYDQLGRLIEDLQAEQGDLKRILGHYFAEHPKQRVPLPGGEALGLHVKEQFDYDTETLYGLLENWELKDKFLKLDRARLERWLLGDRLNDAQKEQIAQTRLRVGSSSRLTKHAAPSTKAEAAPTDAPAGVESAAGPKGEPSAHG